MTVSRSTLLRRPARRLADTALALLLAAAPILPATAPARAEETIVSVPRSQQTVTLGLNKTRVLVLSADAHDILVANPEVADAVTRDARRIYIFGKQVGQTNIIVFDSRNRQIASVDLRIERDISGLSSSIRKYVPGAEVEVEMINDNVVLTGFVQTPQDASKVERLARLFVTGGEATTGQYIQSATAGGAAGGFGAVGFDQEQRQTSQIVNLLQIAGEDQVTLKVTVAEVQRSVIKQLGLNGSASGTIDGLAFQTLTENPLGIMGKAVSDSGGLLAGQIGDVTIDQQLSALEQAGVMKTLAEPSLTAISGEKASFKVGGTFNVTDGGEFDPGTPARRVFKGYDGNNNPVFDEEPATPASRTIQTKEIDYGIGLDFTPVVLNPGRISLKIRTAVSEPTFEGTVNIAGGRQGGASTVGIRKRLADTTVELPSGGSLVIAGLVRDEQRQVISGYPGLSKLPILGTLFRSRDFQRYETELVIIVTPYLVRPVARPDLARPDDNLSLSSDGAANFLGRVNRVYGRMETSKPPGRYHGVVGYIYK